MPTCGRHLGFQYRHCGYLFSFMLWQFWEMWPQRQWHTTCSGSEIVISSLFVYIVLPYCVMGLWDDMPCVGFGRFFFPHSFPILINVHTNLSHTYKHAKHIANLHTYTTIKLSHHFNLRHALPTNATTITMPLLSLHSIVTPKLAVHSPLFDNHTKTITSTHHAITHAPYRLHHHLNLTITKDTCCRLWSCECNAPFRSL